jgi:diacylglycerol kinase (ATP)
VVSGYFENEDAKRPPIGVMPIGTGNAFARDLGLATFGLERAVDAICGGSTRPIDVGRLTTGDRVWHFLNIVGLGFVSDVTATAHRLKGLGNVSYTLGVIYQTLFLKTHRLHLEIDGEVLERDGVFLEISNSRYTSNFLMAPAAEIDDGLLDVTLLTEVSRRRLLSAFPKVFTGEHVDLDEVETYTARRLTVRTEVAKLLAPDGEIEGTTPVEVECLHRALEVFA